MLGGVAGAGIAVGPILDGWLTTGDLQPGSSPIRRGSDRDPPPDLHRRCADGEGARETGPASTGSARRSRAGLSVVVLGVLQSSSWGWLEPRNPPFEESGLLAGPFLIAAGLILIYAFVNRQRSLEERDWQGLAWLSMFRNPVLGSGLQMFCAQNLITSRIFTPAIPLYLRRYPRSSPASRRALHPDAPRLDRVDHANAVVAGSPAPRSRRAGSIRLGAGRDAARGGKRPRWRRSTRRSTTSPLPWR